MLLDVLLPDVSGFAVAEALASDPGCPLVVLVSSRSASDVRAGIEQSPACGFIAKSELTAAAVAALVNGTA